MTAPRKVSIWDVISSEEIREQASDKVIARALDGKTVASITKDKVTEVKEALADVTDVAGLLKVSNAVRETYGNQESVARLSAALKASVKVMQAVRKAVILDAKQKGLLGRGAGQVTGVALAEALGCSKQYVTNVANGHSTPRVGDKTDDDKTDDTEPNGTEPRTDATEDTTTDPMVALEQAITRVSNASKKIVGTPDNAEDLRRMANALDLAAKHLRSVANVDKSATA